MTKVALGTKPFFSARIDPDLFAEAEKYRDRNKLTRPELLQLALSLLLSEEQPEYYPDKLLLSVNEHQQIIAMALLDLGTDSLTPGIKDKLRAIVNRDSAILRL